MKLSKFKQNYFNFACLFTFINHFFASYAQSNLNVFQQIFSVRLQLRMFQFLKLRAQFLRHEYGVLPCYFCEGSITLIANVFYSRPSRGEMVVPRINAIMPSFLTGNFYNRNKPFINGFRSIYLAPSIRFLVRRRRRKAKLYARGHRRA